MRINVLTTVFVGYLLSSAWADHARAADLLIVLNKSDDTASLLDARTGATKATVPVGHAPHEVSVLADGKTAAASNYGTRDEPGQTLTLIDLAKAASSGTVQLGDGTRP